MSDEKTVKSNGTLSTRNALLVAIASAVVGGTGGPFLLVKLGGPSLLRPDPFTGSEAKILERRLEALEHHTKNHPDTTNRFDSRISTLEAQIDLVITNQQRILNKLDRM